MSIEFTKVSRTLFRKSKKFRGLDDDGRLLYLYLLVCEHNNSAGCFQLSEGYALADLGWQADRFAKGMERVSKAGLVSWDRDCGTVLIEGWVAFNEPSNARHAMGILSQLDEVDSEPLKAKRFAEINPIIRSKKLTNERIVGADLAALLRGFAYPIETVSAPKTETETQTETETKNEKETETKTEPVVIAREEISDTSPPLRSVAAEGRDELAALEQGAGEIPHHLKRQASGGPSPALLATLAKQNARRGAA